MKTTKTFLANWMVWLKIFKLILLIGLQCSFLAEAKVEILPYKQNSWRPEWSESLYGEMDKDEFRALLEGPVDEQDLAELGCPGLNQQTEMENKKDFWLVFLSALTRAESGFNPKARAGATKKGQGNFGLLQFSPQTAGKHCGLSTKEELYGPVAHLKCGLKLFAWQINGAPNEAGKELRPDLKRQLFGKNMFLWGPLRQNDRQGRALLVGWFKKHLEQMAFCSVSR